MKKLMVAVSFLLLGSLATSPARAADPPAADPPAAFNPLKGLLRSPFSAEFEIDSGAITGKSVGAAFDSATKGNLGLRFNFGFFKFLNFSLGYLYSPQTRTLTATLPPVGALSQGVAILRAKNLNMFYGSGELNLLHLPRATFYLSPGIGFARNGARTLTFITPLGSGSTPILPGTAVSFNLGAGVKVFPLKHLGFRIEARDFVSGGGTGSLNSSLPPPPAIPCTPLGPPGCLSGTQFFGPMPVQNNIVLTVGLIFKIL